MNIDIVLQQILQKENKNNRTHETVATSMMNEVDRMITVENKTITDESRQNLRNRKRNKYS